MASLSILRYLLSATILCQFIAGSSVYAKAPKSLNKFYWYGGLPTGPVDIEASSPLEPWETYGPNVTDSDLDFDYISMRAYRLSTDYSNYVVFNSEQIDDLFYVNYTGNQFTVPNIVTDLFVNQAEFEYSVNPNATTPDLWNVTSEWQPVELQVSILANNLACFDDTKTITINTTDADGITQNFTAVNVLELDLNGTLPIYLQLGYAENPEYQLSFEYPPTDKILYRLGDGPVQPEVPSSLVYSTIYFFC